MWVDIACGACATAVERIDTGRTTRPIVLTSFVDDPQVVRDWLQQLNVSLPVAENLWGADALEVMPRRLTPLYLEFEGHEPAGVHVGQPKHYWLEVRWDMVVHGLWHRANWWVKVMPSSIA
jgi:hypothetical protein